MLWNEFQDTAERLAHGATEGDWRSAVSRGYYAVFHYFRKFFLTHGVNVGQGGQCHFNLHAGLSNCGLVAVEEIGARLDELRTDRTGADYDSQPCRSSICAGCSARKPQLDRRLSSVAEDHPGRANRRRREALSQVHRPIP